MGPRLVSRRATLGLRLVGPVNVNTSYFTLTHLWVRRLGRVRDHLRICAGVKVWKVCRCASMKACRCEWVRSRIAAITESVKVRRWKCGGVRCGAGSVKWAVEGLPTSHFTLHTSHLPLATSHVPPSTEATLTGVTSGDVGGVCCFGGISGSCGCGTGGGGGDGVGVGVLSRRVDDDRQAHLVRGPWSVVAWSVVSGPWYVVTWYVVRGK